MYDLYATTNKIPLKQRTRFQLLLKNDTWEAVYKDSNTNYMFNSFLCTLLNTFQLDFQLHLEVSTTNEWVDYRRNENISQA